MAELNRKSSSSRSGSRRESLDETNQGDSFVFDKRFFQLLRKLPDELERLVRLEREQAKASPSRYKLYRRHGIYLLFLTVDDYIVTVSIDNSKINKVASISCVVKHLESENR